MKDATIAVTVGLVIACLFVIGQLEGLQPDRPPYLAAYNPHGSLGTMLLNHGGGDGQIMIALSRDPFMESPAIVGGVGEYAYRWQRPIPLWLLAAVPASLRAVGMLIMLLVGTVLMCWQVSRLLAERGLPAWLGFTAAMLPGAVASYRYLGPFALGMGLVIYGYRRRKPIPLAAAGLIAEVFLIVPLYLAVRKRDWTMLYPTALFALWAVIVRLQVGAWFFQSSNTRRGFLEWHLMVLSVI